MRNQKRQSLQICETVSGTDVLRRFNVGLRHRGTRERSDKRRINLVAAEPQLTLFGELRVRHRRV